MARTHYVKKAQASKYARRCRTCGHEIAAGEPYKWAKPRSHRGARGTKMYWCKDHSPKASQMTSSEALSTLYAAQEDAEEALNNATDAESIVEAVQNMADGVREAGEVYTNSADNMESGFGTATSVSDEIREKGEALESWADELDSFELSDEAPDEPDEADFDEPDPDDPDAPKTNADGLTLAEAQEQYDADLSDWLESAQGEAQDAINNVPL